MERGVGGFLRLWGDGGAPGGRRARRAARSGCRNGREDPRRGLEGESARPAPALAALPRRAEGPRPVAGACVAEGGRRAVRPRHGHPAGGGGRRGRRGGGRRLGCRPEAGGGGVERGAAGGPLRGRHVGGGREGGGTAARVQRHAHGAFQRNLLDARADGPGGASPSPRRLRCWSRTGGAGATSSRCASSTGACRSGRRRGARSRFRFPRRTAWRFRMRSRPSCRRGQTGFPSTTGRTSSRGARSTSPTRGCRTPRRASTAGCGTWAGTSSSSGCRACRSASTA